MSAMGRFAWMAAGTALVLIGIIWILQGLSLFPGTFMFGDPVWSLVGLATALAGAAVLLVRLLNDRGVH
jgi:hypothetical protein